MRTVKLFLILIFAVLHFAISFNMFGKTMHIPPAQSGFQPHPLNEQEMRDLKGSAIVNVPFVTLHEKRIFYFPGGVSLIPFALDSILWSIVIVLLLPWLYIKLKATILVRPDA